MKLTLYATAVAAALVVAESCTMDPEEGLKCATAQMATSTSGPCSGMTVGGTCPAGCQELVDTVYADCGGTCTLLGAEWDVENGKGAKWTNTVNAMGCSDATAAAPVFALVAAAMAFFN